MTFGQQIFISILTSTILSSFAAADVLKNCYEPRGAQFFASELEDIALEKETPVLLLNDKKEVVGVLSVSPKRAIKTGVAKVVTVNKVSLCSSLKVEDFYYADGAAANLLEWFEAPSIEIAQDEGLIKMFAKIESRDSYANLIKVEFKAYDVFSESDEVDEQTRKSPDYIEDWGLPKGSGTFYFYIPSKWSLK